MFKSSEEYEEYLAKHVLTTREAMSLLGVKHRQQLYHWIKGGKLKPLKIEDNITLFSLQEVERFSKQRRRLK